MAGARKPSDAPTLRTSRRRSREPVLVLVIILSATQSKMTRPAYLVEGDLEQKFIQNTCPGCKVQKINCNGDDVSLEAIAKRVGSLGRFAHTRHSPLIVIFDRERRDETSEQIEAKFREILTHEQIQVPIIVGIPDRDTESW